MKIKIRIDRDVCRLLNSLERIIILKNNISFISKLPLLKDEKRFAGKKINYKKGYREIRVMRGFKMVKVTRGMEKKKNYPKGVYNFTSEPSNFLEYDISDYAEVENLGEEIFINERGYNEKELKELRK